MFKLRAGAAFLLVLAMILLGMASPAAAATSPSAACRAPALSPRDDGFPTTLSNIRTGRHDSESFDRVVFDLGRVPSYQINYVPQVIQDGSGEPITLLGTAFLNVRLSPATGGPSVPRDLKPNFPSLKEVKAAGDFEGVVTYGIGVASKTDFRVLKLSSPNRLVVDVAFPGTHPWDCRSGAVAVYFANSDASGVVAVTRRVPVPAVANGALAGLYAGPTPTESAAGLSFVSSNSFYFRKLSISGGVAKVELYPECSSGGSTFTIANEIMPTLKQFPTVTYVKIFDPSGNTEVPTGNSDSIPECLEP